MPTAQVECWIQNQPSEFLGDSWQELRFIRQAVSFLVRHLFIILRHLLCRTPIHGVYFVQCQCTQSFGVLVQHLLDFRRLLTDKEVQMGDVVVPLAVFVSPPSLKSLNQKLCHPIRFHY